MIITRNNISKFFSFFPPSFDAVAAYSRPIFHYPPQMPALDSIQGIMSPQFPTVEFPHVIKIQQAQSEPRVSG